MFKLRTRHVKDAVEPRGIRFDSETKQNRVVDLIDRVYLEAALANGPSTPVSVAQENASASAAALIVED